MLVTVWNILSTAHTHTRIYVQECNSLNKWATHLTLARNMVAEC